MEPDVVVPLIECILAFRRTCKTDSTQGLPGLNYANTIKTTSSAFWNFARHVNPLDSYMCYDFNCYIIKASDFTKPKNMYKYYLVYSLVCGSCGYSRGSRPRHCRHLRPDNSLLSGGLCVVASLVAYLASTHRCSQHIARCDNQNCLQALLHLLSRGAKLFQVAHH